MPPFSPPNQQQRHSPYRPGFPFVILRKRHLREAKVANERSLHLNSLSQNWSVGGHDFRGAVSDRARFRPRTGATQARTHHSPSAT